jgi:hypothetical protein
MSNKKKATRVTFVDPQGNKRVGVKKGNIIEATGGKTYNARSVEHKEVSIDWNNLGVNYFPKPKKG